jgi:hypothetical protein
MELHVCGFKSTTQKMIRVDRIDRNERAACPKVECNYGMYLQYKEREKQMKCQKN